MYEDIYGSVIFTSKRLEIPNMSTSELLSELWCQSTMDILTELGNSMFCHKWAPKYIVIICVPKKVSHIQINLHIQLHIHRISLEVYKRNWYHSKPLGES